MFPTNHQSSGNLSSNNRQPFTGNLFTSNQSGSSFFLERPISSLSQLPNPFLQKRAPPASKEVPFYGTVDYIGKSLTRKTCDGYGFTCITATIKNCSLDELRIQDYYNMKRNLLPPAKKQLVNTTISKNSSKRHQNEFPNDFDPSRGPKNPFLSEEIHPQSSSSKTTQPMKNLFADLKACFVDAAEPQNKIGNPFRSQQRAFTIANNFGMKPTEENQAPASQNSQCGSHQAQFKESVAKRQEPSSSSGKPKQEMISNAVSFSYEVNKMVLVSSFVSLLQNHKVLVPENLLDNTDFMPQLFEFLKTYNMSLPTTNIPQFPLNTLTSLSALPKAKSKTNSKRRRRNRKKASQRASEKKSKEEEKIGQMNLPLKEVSNLIKPTPATEQLSKKEAPQKETFPESPEQKKSLPKEKLLLNFVNKEEEEKIEIRDGNGEVEKDQSKEEENVVYSSENDTSESGVISVHSSEESSSDGDSVSH